MSIAGRGDDEGSATYLMDAFWKWFVRAGS
jgi:hypothetical protein